jgi:putative RNA 2'-phosphotransferase
LSRFLAFVLRHHPEEINVTLDERGAADLDALAEGVKTRRGFENITREKIEQLAATGPAAVRFEIIGNRIRARYGHSLPQAIEYEAAQPPEFLFHGTTPESADAILAEGMKPVERQLVHLSADTPAAREVGRRRCPDPVILRINTAAARKAGVQFYPGGPAVWLSDALPPKCITRVE